MKPPARRLALIVIFCGALALIPALIASLDAAAAAVPGPAGRGPTPVTASVALGNTVAYTFTVEIHPDAGGLAFNERHETIGSRKIWLPEPNYGLPAGFHDLPTIPGADQNSATGLSEGGIVAGWSRLQVVPVTQYQPWRWHGGTTTFLENGVDTFGQALDINRDGDIAGWIWNGSPGSPREPIIWFASGSRHEPGQFGLGNTEAQAINTLGDLAGIFYPAVGDRRPFFWSSGYTELPLPTGMDWVEIEAVNDDGMVIGWVSGGPAGFRRAVMWDGFNGLMFDLGDDSDLWSWARGINSIGQVVGTVSGSLGNRAVLWDDGNRIDLNDLIDPNSGWILKGASDINEKGEIMGWGSLGGTQQTFLLTPYKPWTVMLYLDGDNDLDDTYPPIVDQLETVADNPAVNVVVLWDNTTNGDSAYVHLWYDPDLANWESEWLGYEENVRIWPQGELDMSDPDTLIDFITWTNSQFPSQQQALLLSDHGSGLGGGLCEGNTCGSLMDLFDMQYALQEGTLSDGGNIEVLYMDMCLMGMIEDGFQFKAYADYYVASEYLQWAYDAPYSAYIAGITENSTAAEVAIQFAASYAAVAAAEGDPYTISATNLGAIDPLVEATNLLGDVLDANMAVISPTLTLIANDVQRFDMNGDKQITATDTYIDLYHFAELATQQLIDYPDIVAAAALVMAEVDNYVIAESHGSTATHDLSNSHGVSIFFPAVASSFYSAENYDFAVGAEWGGAAPPLPTDVTGAGGTWGAFLVSYFAATQPDGPDDPTPPLPLPRLVPELFEVFLPAALRP